MGAGGKGSRCWCDDGDAVEKVFSYVDAVDGGVHRNAARPTARAHGGDHGVGGPVDHGDDVFQGGVTESLWPPGHEIGHVDEVSAGIYANANGPVAHGDGGDDGVGRIALRQGPVDDGDSVETPLGDVDAVGGRVDPNEAAFTAARGDGGDDAVGGPVDDEGDFGGGHVDAVGGGVHRNAHGRLR